MSEPREVVGWRKDLCPDCGCPGAHFCTGRREWLEPPSPKPRPAEFLAWHGDGSSETVTIKYPILGTVKPDGRVVMDTATADPKRRGRAER